MSGKEACSWSFETGNESGSSSSGGKLRRGVVAPFGVVTVDEHTISVNQRGIELGLCMRLPFPHHTQIKAIPGGNRVAREDAPAPNNPPKHN